MDGRRCKYGANDMTGVGGGGVQFEGIWWPAVGEGRALGGVEKEKWYTHIMSRIQIRRIRAAYYEWGSMEVMVVERKS